MRIILSTYNFYPFHKGGTEVYTSALAKYLMRRGHEVLVIAAIDGSDTAGGQVIYDDEEIRALHYHYDGIAVAGITLKSQPLESIYTLAKEAWTDAFTKILPQLGWADPSHLIMNGLTAVSGLSLCCALLELNPLLRMGIIVHTPFVCPKADMINRATGGRCEVVMSESGCAACMISANTKMPYAISRLLPGMLDGIGTLFSLPSLPWSLRKLLLMKFKTLKWMNGQTLSWVVFSGDMGGFLRKQRFIMPEKVAVIRHGIDKTVFFSTRKEALSPAPVRFLYAGRFEEIKGVGVLADAWQKTEDRPEERLLYLAGNWQETDTGAAVAARLKGRRDVIFMGSVPQQELAGLYRDTHCVIIPSKWVETGPLVFHEAIACGCDIISSDIGGQGELAGVYPEKTFLFSSGDAGSLYKAIREYTPSNKRSANQPASEEEHYTAVIDRLNIR